MYLLFLIMWIVFNGKITLEIVLFGVVISAFVYWFLCKFMEYQPRMELKILKNFMTGLCYVILLVWEIMKANFHVIGLILTSKYEVEPILFYFRTDLKTDSARVALANAITLTPGTITVTLENDEYCIHCLDQELTEGIVNSVFVKLLHKMENR